MSITISIVDEEFIQFSDGSRIVFDHDPDCCEHNYADFKQIDDLALSTGFNLPLNFEMATGGFRFGNKPDKMFYIPCYSSQNGYYSTNIDIYYKSNLVLKLKCQEDFL